MALVSALVDALEAVDAKLGTQKWMMPSTS
jgi:hypothetical protein